MTTGADNLWIVQYSILLISSANGMLYLPNAGTCEVDGNTTSVHPSGTSGDVKDITSSDAGLFLQDGGIAGGPPFLILFFSGSSVCSRCRFVESFVLLSDA